MTSEETPHRLSIIGYWSSSDDLPEESRGFPDPRDLAADWDAQDLRAIVSHLRRGKAFRSFLGAASCRICQGMVGGRELTDGQWAWPEGLIHYVEQHRVKLPPEFVNACRRSQVSRPARPAWLASLKLDFWVQTGAGPDSASPVDGDQAPVCVTDDTAWLDWAAQNTPARPQGDAVSLDDARAVCRRVSHPAWTANVDEVMGRWCIRYGDQRLYLQKCSAAILERRLLSVRHPDPTHLLDADRANMIAAEYDGSWGAARIVFTSDVAWLVWVKRPEGQWPTDEDEQAILDEPCRFGSVTFRVQRGAKSFPIPPVDETAWRWLLTNERDEATRTPQPSVAANE